MSEAETLFARFACDNKADGILNYGYAIRESSSVVLLVVKPASKLSTSGLFFLFLAENFYRFELRLIGTDVTNILLSVGSGRVLHVHDYSEEASKSSQ